MNLLHLPVMAAGVVELMVTRTDGAFVDCTISAGGHAAHILNNAPEGTLLGIDCDGSAIEAARENLRPFGERVRLAKGSFADLATLASDAGIEHADGVLFDLGLSSIQLDDPGRGFSFQAEGPIDMRYDTDRAATARDFLSRVSERELAGIIREFGEEKRAHPIARAIIRAREKGELSTTKDLANAVLSTKPVKRTKTLARVFQSIRVYHNREIEVLRAGLEQAVALLRPGGRICTITYESLTDRVVKQFFVRSAKPCVCPPDIPQCACGLTPTLRIITKKVVVPSQSEIARNPRARSAKLRAAEKLPEKGNGEES